MRPIHLVFALIPVALSGLVYAQGTGGAWPGAQPGAPVGAPVSTTPTPGTPASGQTQAQVPAGMPVGTGNQPQPQNAPQPPCDADDPRLAQLGGVLQTIEQGQPIDKPITISEATFIQMEPQALLALKDHYVVVQPDCRHLLPLHSKLTQPVTAPYQLLRPRILQAASRQDQALLQFLRDNFRADSLPAPEAAQLAGAYLSLGDKASMALSDTFALPTNDHGMLLEGSLFQALGGRSNQPAQATITVRNLHPEIRLADPPAAKLMVFDLATPEDPDELMWFRDTLRSTLAGIGITVVPRNPYSSNAMALPQPAPPQPSSASKDQAAPWYRRLLQRIGV